MIATTRDTAQTDGIASMSSDELAAFSAGTVALVKAPAADGTISLPK